MGSLPLRFLVVGVAVAAPLGPAAACQTPIAYAIGEVDPRFELSRGELGIAIRDAARLWESAAGRELFVHRPDAELRIRLEYSKPQRTTERIRDLESGAADLRERIEDLEGRLETAKRRLGQATADYRRRARAFEQDRQAFRDRLERLKAREDPPAEEVAALRQRRERLRERAQRLEARRREVQDRKARVNRLAVEANSLVLRHNEQVRERNELARPAEQFRQGQFEPSDRGGGEIAIRQFAGAGELRFALAHELGHALGLGHLDDPRALMHARLEERERPRLVLTEADREALRRVCNGER